jgi:predicted acylesterase/phospholipase RssA
MLWRIAKRIGRPYGVVSGTSAGALNAAALVQHGPGWLVEFWQHIRRDQVLSGRDPSKIRAAYRILRGRPLYDASPLRELIYQNLNPEAIRNSPIRLFIHATAPHRRVLAVWRGDSPDLLEGIYASAMIPLAFRPVRIGDVDWVDGGVLGNVPIRSAVEIGCTEVTVILPDHRVTPYRLAYEQFQERRDPEPDPEGDGLVETASGLLDVLIDTQFERDRQSLADQARIDVLRPEKDLGGTLDFDPDHLRELLMLGALEAMRWDAHYREQP